jgi:hypothetical protein
VRRFSEKTSQKEEIKTKGTILKQQRSFQILTVIASAKIIVGLTEKLADFHRTNSDA